MTACTTGDLRAFNDAMSGSNGQTVTYPDQSDTDYVGDIKLVTGVKNGSGFLSLKNTGDDYCKVKVDFEDGSNRIYSLDPGESTGRTYVSIYNQEDNINTMCHYSKRVFNESFD